MLRSSKGYEILRCVKCSLVFTDDRNAPSAEQLYPAFDQSGRRFARKIGWMLKIFLRQREAFVRRLKASGRLLDFGCGNGAFALQMSEGGFDAVGIEPFSLVQRLRPTASSSFSHPGKPLPTRSEHSTSLRCGMCWSTCDSRSRCYGASVPILRPTASSSCPFPTLPACRARCFGVAGFISILHVT